MRIDNVDVKPAQDSINPEMIFEIELYIQRGSEIPVEICGSVKSDEDKRIANIYGCEFTTRIDEKIELSARDLTQDVKIKGEQKLTIEVKVPLNHKVLDYIEDRRAANPKGDVMLNLDIRIRSLCSRVIISPVFSAEGTGFPTLPKDYEFDGFVLRGDPSSRSPQSTLNILSDDSGTTFIELANVKEVISVTIASSDWIHDFCPVFGIGKFLVLEYLIPDYVEGTDDIKERLRRSIDVIKKMEECVIKCKWNEVIEHSRRVGELLKNHQDDEIKVLLTMDGYTDEAFTSFNRILIGLYDFASKFLHEEDKSKKIMDDIKASKEDAYLIYAVSVNVVNLISKKMQRLNK